MEIKKPFKREDVYHSTFNYFKGDTLATDVWMNKYALKDLEGNFLEYNPNAMFKRIAQELHRIEQKYPNSLSYNEIYELLKDFKYVIPGGSNLYGIGNNIRLSSLGNCFVIGNTADSYGGIFLTDQEQTQLMKMRAGVGHDISHYRPKGVVVSNTAGTSVGIVPLMERFSNSTREVSQNGRRGALMLTIDVRHPDVIDFIKAKEDLTKVTGANISVRVNDDFMDCVKHDLDYHLTFPVNMKIPLGEYYDELMSNLKHNELVEVENIYDDGGTLYKKGYIKLVKAKEIWNLMMYHAWKSAEPGILFWDTILRESPADLYEGFESTSTNPCLSGDTWVTTEKGPQQIKDLIGKGKIKLLKDGQFYESTEEGFFKTGHKPIYELILENGCKIKATNNHKFLTNQGWVELKSLEVGDKVILSNNSNVEWVGEGNKEEGWLLGNFIGDGTFYESTSKIQYWGDDKEEMGNKAINLLDKLNNNTHKFRIDEKHNRLNINSKDLFNLAKKWGVVKNNKYLTPQIEKGSSEFYKGILGGLFDADGCVWLSNGCITVDISQSNKLLLEQAQRMLSRLGITSTISLSHKEGNKLLPGPKYYENGEMKEYYCKNCYILRISGRINVGIFFDNMEILDNNKISKYKDLIEKYTITPYKTKFHSKVKSISYFGVEDVYDCTIPETSCFDANGMITHNCGEIVLTPYDSCRLLSINLFGLIDNPFTSNSKINWEKFEGVVYKAQKLMDDIVDLEEEKINKILNKLEGDFEEEHIKSTELELWKKIKEKLLKGRRTGLSLIGIGDSLAALGIKYGTVQATDIIERLFKTLALQSYRASIDMAKDRGAFPVWESENELYNPYIARIMEYIDEPYQSNYIKYGRRNIANLTIPPSGSLSILAQITSGIEPVFALYYTRRRKVDKNHHKIDFVDQSGDCWEEYKVFHPKFKDWYYINFGEDKILEDLPTEELNKIIEKSPYYGATTNEINYKEKVKMQGAIQKWVDHSISVTHNLPENITQEEISEIYKLAYESGCKGCTIYRDNSRSGVLIKDNPKPKSNFETLDAYKRPKSLECHIHSVTIKGEAYIVLVGILDNKPYEVFALKQNGYDVPKIKKGYLTKVKRGMYNLLDINKEILIEDITSHFEKPIDEAITRLASMSLRHGAHIKFIVEQLNKTPTEINDFSKVIARTIKKYVKDNEASTENCPICSTKLRFQNGCVDCPSCGFSKC